MAIPEPSTLAAAAARIATEAGALIRDRSERPRAIATKSGAVDLVTDTDRAAERLILDRLREAYPEHAILSEESGAIEPPGDAEVAWVIDPLDGTTNFAHGVPHFAVSIAAVLRPRLADGTRSREPRAQHAIAGAVYDPMREELFVAHEGGATTLDGRPVAVSAEAALDASLLATGFPYDRREHAELYLSFWRTLLVQARDVRRIGAAALDLAWVACGRFDAFWEWRLKPWDVAAGNLLVRCAGGTVTDFRGEANGIDAAQTLASNGRIHDQLLAAMAPLLDGDRR